MKQRFKKKNYERSVLAVDLEKKNEHIPPEDLRGKFYKDPSHGGGLRAALLDIYIYIYICVCVCTTLMKHNHAEAQYK